MDWTKPSACTRVNIMCSTRVVCILGCYLGIMTMLVLKLFFLYIFLASFPLCIEKSLRSKVQSRDFQTYLSHKADVCSLQKVFPIIIIQNVLSFQYLTCLVFFFWNLVFSNVSLTSMLRGRSHMLLVYIKDTYFNNNEIKLQHVYYFHCWTKL